MYKVRVHGQWAALKVLRPKRTKVPCGVVPEVMFFREARALKYCKHRWVNFQIVRFGFKFRWCCKHRCVHLAQLA